jgi:hypothetical protein
MATLFDQFISAGKQRRRHGEAERLGGLKIEMGPSPYRAFIFPPIQILFQRQLIF